MLVRKNRFLMIHLFAALFIASGSLVAQSNVQKQVAEAARQKFDAMVSADLTKLRSAFHDSLRYIHSSGNIDTKASIIANIQSKKEDYHSIKTSDETVQMFNQNKMGIYTAKIEIIMAGKENDPPTRLLITEVYNKYSSGWQLIRRHASRLP